MRSISRRLAAAALASVLFLPAIDGGALAQSPPAAPFTSPLAAKDAERLEATLKAHGRPRQGAAELRRAGLAALERKDAREAVKALGQALAADARHAPTFLALARAYQAITPDANSGERYELPALAAGAAWRSYTLASEPKEKAAALVVLAEALKARSLWRPAIDALEASLRLADDAAARETLAKLRAEHGFRMVDYKVDADTAEPRLCLNFSERLAGTQGDLAKFVAVDGRDPQNVTVEGRQLCIDGLQHGRRYEVQVRAGLPSEAAEALVRAAELAVYVRDRAAAVRFPGRAYVLASRGQQGVPVVTVNASQVAVEIFRIGDRGLAGLAGSDTFLRQLQGHDVEQIRERHGQRVWTGELAVAERANEDVTTAIPVSEAIGRLEPGVYVLTAAVAARPGREGPGEKATQWFVISDLGLSALSGEDGLHAFVRSIASAAPAAGVGVRLVARNNELLATGRTDAAGYVRFDAGLRRGEGGMAPALLVAETGADYAFLDLATSAFDLTDRGVKGREAPGALDAYLFAERGVYRPGESVHLTGLVRDRAARAATLPVTLIVLRPDGVEHRRVTLPDQGLGGRSLALAIAPTAMTGTWRARLHADPKAEPLAQTAFLVEDFVPERLDLALTPAARTISVEETGRIAIAGRYLYGPPAAGLEIEGEIVVRPATGDLEGLAGYRFGRTDELVGAVRKPLEDLPKADAQGRAEVAFRLPPLPKTERLLEADVVLRLKEPGGRAVERTVTLPVGTGAARVGVRPLFAGAVGDGETAELDVALVGADGRPLEAKGVKWELVRLDQRWQWYARDGQWNYEAITTTRRVATGTVDAAPGKPGRISVKPDWGRYRLDVTAVDGGRTATTSITFNAGWYGSGEGGIESPEALDVALDKPAYKAGETARLKIASREGGRAQIAVLSSGLLLSRQVDIPAGGGEVALEVKGDWLPGAYVTATLFRPMDEKARRMPSRAIGVRWLGVDARERQLKVELEAPRTVKPASRIEVPLRLAGLAAGEAARVTVAAVDVGILNLTRYEAPAPEKWFHAQRRLGTELRDLYGRLIDGMRADRGRLRSGGDGGGLAIKGSPPVERPLALHSGIVTVGADGRASVAFDLPDFNGTVRLMAVAWSADKVGSGQADVIVREALALTATAPRFLTLGDTARLAVDLHNIEAPAGGIRIAVAKEGPAGARRELARRELQLAPGARAAEHVTVKPEALGPHVLDIEVAAAGGAVVRRRIAVDVKAPSGDIRRVVTSSLAPAGGKLTLSRDLLADLIPGSARISLVAGPTARLDTASLLTQLDRYPHGCAEQTTSRALPLLYVSQLATRLGLAEDAEIRPRIEQAIERVLEMQDASGAFGAWGPSAGDIWLTAYVADFLTRAKEQGFAVRPQPFAQALDRLANHLGYAQDFERGGEARAYALYVLARNGRAPAGDLRWLADTRLDRFATPLAQAQLGAALALMGDKERAERAFRAAVGVIEKVSDQTAWNGARGDYGSFLRDGAGIVALAAETGIARQSAPGLTGVLAGVYRTRQYTSTQEQAWMLLAARALAEEARDTRLAVDGRPHQGELSQTVAAADLAQRAVEIVNTGDKAVDAVVSVTGASLTPEPAVARGFTISRKAYTLDGKEIDLARAGASLRQNDRLVIALTIEGAEAGGRVVVVDRLPAGLEIENPRLVAGGELKGFDWLEQKREPAHTEFRDDRFVAAFDFFGARQRSEKPEADHAAKATVAYVVRAVTPGSFVHPAATVEDMYRPERFARTVTGRIEIGSRN